MRTDKGRKIIYADNAATTGVSQHVLEEMLPYMVGKYGNPSSAHTLGREAIEAVELSRAVIAKCIGAQPEEIYFTSGGTESDNMALRSGAKIGEARNKRHIITSAIEHHAVLNVVEELPFDGFSYTLVGVNEDGLVEPRDVDVALQEETVMVSVMMANNETGMIQPVKEIGALCRNKGIIFHTDAVQAVGHIRVNVSEMNIDMLSMSAHKFHGPKGVGALYVREGTPVYPLLYGGGQEHGIRSGTENVAGIVGMAVALSDSCDHLLKNGKAVLRMRNALIDGILEAVPWCRLNGILPLRLPGNVSMCIDGVEGPALVLRMDADGICVSSGSACTTGTLEPSHVLKAMGVPEELIGGALRITLSEENTMEDVEAIVRSVAKNVKELRKMSPTWKG